MWKINELSSSYSLVEGEVERKSGSPENKSHWQPISASIRQVLRRKVGKVLRWLYFCVSGFIGKSIKTKKTFQTQHSSLRTLRRASYESAQSTTSGSCYPRDKRSPFSKVEMGQDWDVNSKIRTAQSFIILWIRKYLEIKAISLHCLFAQKEFARVDMEKKKEKRELTFVCRGCIMSIDSAMLGCPRLMLERKMIETYRHDLNRSSLTRYPCGSAARRQRTQQRRPELNRREFH